MKKPEKLYSMSGSEAWDAYYKDKIRNGVPVHPDLLKEVFLAGVNHAVEYVREAQS